MDCDNEQNAALLFKSAKNSGSNAASLAVAVVEGQTGVAKAFRLGAESGFDQTHSCRAVQGDVAGCARPAAQGTGRQGGRSDFERGSAVWRFLYSL